MKFFSILIKRFLSQVDADDKQRIQIVPKTSSGIQPGDIVFFKYEGDYVLVLAVSPVIKDATTGNRLFTGFKVPFSGEYTPESLQTLYKNKELPKENYRTYILKKTPSVVRRIQ